MLNCSSSSRHSETLLPLRVHIVTYIFNIRNNQSGEGVLVSVYVALHDSAAVYCVTPMATPYRLCVCLLDFENLKS